jgi:hypothetical protein
MDLYALDLLHEMIVLSCADSETSILHKVMTAMVINSVVVLLGHPENQGVLPSMRDFS